MWQHHSQRLKEMSPQRVFRLAIKAVMIYTCMYAWLPPFHKQTTEPLPLKGVAKVTRHFTVMWSGDPIISIKMVKADVSTLVCKLILVSTNVRTTHTVAIIKSVPKRTRRHVFEHSIPDTHICPTRQQQDQLSVLPHHRRRKRLLP